MKSFFYVVIAGLLAIAGYMTYDRFSGPSAEDNTLAQAQGVPPPPARLPGVANPAQPAPATSPTQPETIVQEVQQEVQEAAPPPVEVGPSPSYEPDMSADQPQANTDADEGGYCAQNPNTSVCSGG